MAITRLAALRIAVDSALSARASTSLRPASSSLGTELSEARSELRPPCFLPLLSLQPAVLRLGDATSAFARLAYRRGSVGLLAGNADCQLRKPRVDRREASSCSSDLHLTCQKCAAPARRASSSVALRTAASSWTSASLERSRSFGGVPLRVHE